MRSENGKISVCRPGDECGWSKGRHSRRISCVTGGSYKRAIMLEAEVSDFHDERLADASRQIRGILNGIENGVEGRVLAFVNTNMGTLLAWVQHGEPIEPDGVTAESANAIVAEALGLKHWEPTSE